MVYGIISSKKGMGRAACMTFCCFQSPVLIIFPATHTGCLIPSCHRSRKDKNQSRAFSTSTAATYICSFLPWNKGIVYLQQRKLFSEVFARVKQAFIKPHGPRRARPESTGAAAALEGGWCRMALLGGREITLAQPGRAGTPESCGHWHG